MTHLRAEGVSFEQELQSFVGRVLVDLPAGQDPVNVPMIRHWVEALELDGGIHLHDNAARESGRGSVVAPAAMTQTWVMRGYASTVRPVLDNPGPQDDLVSVLADAGFSSVVATDSDFEFVRELVPGDVIGYTEVVEAISEQKQTGLGVGHFVTTVKTYRDHHGETVATQRWRTLRFRPSAPASLDHEQIDTEPRPLRPRPALNRDNAFWFEQARQHRLVIQRCAECLTLRHPPGPGCFSCGSFVWDTVEAFGFGRLYSWTVAHHPRDPAFDYPLIIGLVELDEGTRLTTNLVEVQADDLEAGMRLELVWLEADADLTLPVFRPVHISARKDKP